VGAGALCLRWRLHGGGVVDKGSSAEWSLRTVVGFEKVTSKITFRLLKGYRYAPSEYYNTKLLTEEVSWQGCLYSFNAHEEARWYKGHFHYDVLKPFPIL
jgi:hypothetical protein